jgi:uncharacterized protein YukE
MLDGKISINSRLITGKITSIPETRGNIINGYESLKEISNRYAAEYEGSSSKQFTALAETVDSDVEILSDILSFVSSLLINMATADSNIDSTAKKNAG